MDCKYCKGNCIHMTTHQHYCYDEKYGLEALINTHERHFNNGRNITMQSYEDLSEYAEVSKLVPRRMPARTVRYYNQRGW